MGGYIWKNIFHNHFNLIASHSNNNNAIPLTMTTSIGHIGIEPTLYSRHNPLALTH